MSEWEAPLVLDSSAVRVKHRRLLLRKIWSAREISRAELARQTGMSRSTVSSITQELLDTGLITIRRRGVSSGGRRPVMLAFEDDSFVSIGVDLGASHVLVTVTNLRGVVVGQRSEGLNINDGPEPVMDVVKGLIRMILRDVNRDLDDVVGIGVAVPSPVDPKRPGHLSDLILPGWSDFSITDNLRAAFDKPVYVDNDANMGALAELWWGHGVELDTLAYVKIGTGVGAGLIIERKVFRGTAGLAGEVGHFALDPSGPKCICGLNGCINVTLGSKQLVERYNSYLEEHEERVETITQLVTQSRNGNELAQQVFRDAGSQLATGVANLSNLFDPAVIVLGGAITGAGNVFLDSVREELAKRVRLISYEPESIRTSEMGAESIAIGAATMVLDSALQQPELLLSKKIQQEAV